MTGHVSGDYRFENMGITDFPDATHGFLSFKTIDRRLNRGIGGPWFRKCFLDLSNRRLSISPERFEYLKFKLRQLRLSRIVPTIHSFNLLLRSRLVKGK